MTDTRYASRKFMLAAAAFVAGIPLLCVGLISADQWVSYTTWVVGLYCAANVGDQAVTKNG